MKTRAIINDISSASTFHLSDLTQSFLLHLLGLKSLLLSYSPWLERACELHPPGPHSSSLKLQVLGRDARKPNEVEIRGNMQLEMRRPFLWYILSNIISVFCLCTVHCSLLRHRDHFYCQDALFIIPSLFPSVFIAKSLFNHPRIESELLF